MSCVIIITTSSMTLYAKQENVRMELNRETRQKHFLPRIKSRRVSRDSLSNTFLIPYKGLSHRKKCLLLVSVHVLLFSILSVSSFDKRQRNQTVNVLIRFPLHPFPWKTRDKQVLQAKRSHIRSKNQNDYCANC